MVNPPDSFSEDELRALSANSSEVQVAGLPSTPVDTLAGQETTAARI